MFSLGVTLIDGLYIVIGYMSQLPVYSPDCESACRRTQGSTFSDLTWELAKASFCFMRKFLMIFEGTTAEQDPCREADPVRNENGLHFNLLRSFKTCFSWLISAYVFGAYYP